MHPAPSCQKCSLMPRVRLHTALADQQIWVVPCRLLPLGAGHALIPPGLLLC